MSKDKKIKVEFAPGCFDDFNGTQQELDEFVREIQRMVESGELESLAVGLDAVEQELVGTIKSNTRQ